MTSGWLSESRFGAQAITDEAARRIGAVANRKLELLLLLFQAYGCGPTLRPYGGDQYSFCLISVKIYILSLAGFVFDTVWFTLRLQRQRGVIHEAAVTSGVEANRFETLEA